MTLTIVRFRIFYSVLLLTFLTGILSAFASVTTQPYFPDPSNLNRLTREYLSDCASLNKNSRRIQYELTRIYFDDRASVQNYSDSLSTIRQHLDAELSQCEDYADISAALSTSASYFNIALQSDTLEYKGRTLFFYFEQVPDLYRETIYGQILPQIDLVEDIFLDDLQAPLNKESLSFFITNRRIMKEDIGGANLGSFIWLPVEYSLGYGQQWPDGVRESTVRHEIVHAFMNHASRSPAAHLYPRVFVEGMALYLSGNRLIEFHRKTQVRLSDEYIEFLETFDYMEEQSGSRAVQSMIQDMLSGQQTDFFAAFESLAGTPYEAYVESRSSLIEKLESFIQTTLHIPRAWQRYMLVFGIVLAITVLFLTVQVPARKKEEIRRNISGGFLIFIILSLLSQGRLPQMAYDNFIAFILLTLFAAILLRGYPQVRHEDLMKDLREKSVLYQDEEEDGDVL